MGGAEDKIAPGYGAPPWIFKGRAFYQFHLVKAEIARSYIPKEFRLVEAFGYTLGGFFLANYDESPAGILDELVVIAGLIWSPPASCAWAAKVLVNSEEACNHGRKEVGLPSQVATFSKGVTAIENQRKGKAGGFLNIIGLGTIGSCPENQLTVRVAEANDSSVTDTCDVNLTTDSPSQKSSKWMGLPITISLPSFSGRTIHNPNILKYTCEVHCRVRAVKPADVTLPANSNTLKEATEEDSVVEHAVNKDISVSAIMLSKPILALEFSCMRMKVDEPVVVSP